MNKVYIYALFLILLGLVYGCDKADVDNTQVSVGDKQIALNSVSAPVGAGTRAATDFPNNGRIGIVATKELNDTVTLTDWSKYSDISNAGATAVSVSNGIYSFQWDTQKYWPFDGSDLYFMAYSPITTGSNNYLIDAKNSSLFINLQPNMPDIMYASNNTLYKAYNKNSGTVDLGEFRHALSQLTIQVLAGEHMSPNIKLTSLSVSTNATTGNLFLFAGDDGMVPVIDEDNQYTNVLVGGQTEFQNGMITRSLLLFPQTEDYTEISIVLLDVSNGVSFTGSYMISFFQSDTADAITLEQAKNTVLRMVINMTDVQNPNEINLIGRITDWTYKGEFGIDIN